jgi:hypothetical protein
MGQHGLSRMGILSKPSVLTTSAVGSWLPFGCPECGMQLALVHTAEGLFDKENFSIICGTCRVEFSFNEILRHAGPGVLSYLPDGEGVGAEKFGRGREDNIVFGKNLGTSKGNDRNRQMRLAVEGTAPEVSGLQFVSRYYELKAAVGLPESKPMKSALEMVSRKIKSVERARKITIPEPVVDQLAKMIRKGVRNAEARRPTTSRDRRLIVETIMGRMELWPE